MRRVRVTKERLYSEERKRGRHSGTKRKNFTAEKHQETERQQSQGGSPFSSTSNSLRWKRKTKIFYTGKVGSHSNREADLTAGQAHTSCKP
jgi:hypothetical protein